jgi:hypothetical protein
MPLGEHRGRIPGKREGAGRVFFHAETAFLSVWGVGSAEQKILKKKAERIDS